jgi:hypothetical protein
MTDFPRLRRETREMLGFGADEELGPADQIRVDILVALRASLDGQTAKAGSTATDPTKLIALAEALGKLLPAPQPPAQEQHESARDALTRLAKLIEGDGGEATYEGMQAALAEARAENEQLRAELAALKAAGPQPVREPVVEVLPPATTKALPAPEPPQQDAVARANQRTPQPPRHWLKSGQPPEPWSEYFSNDTPGQGHRRWQPT